MSYVAGYVFKIDIIPPIDFEQPSQTFRSIRLRVSAFRAQNLLSDKYIAQFAIL